MAIDHLKSGKQRALAMLMQRARDKSQFGGQSYVPEALLYAEWEGRADTMRDDAFAYFLGKGQEEIRREREPWTEYFTAEVNRAEGKLRPLLRKVEPASNKEEEAQREGRPVEVERGWLRLTKGQVPDYAHSVWDDLMFKQRDNRFAEKPDGQKILRCYRFTREAMLDARVALLDLAEKAIRLEVLKEAIHQANGPSDRFLLMGKKPVDSMQALASLLVREHEGKRLDELVRLGHQGYFVSGRPSWTPRNFKDALRKAIQRTDSNVESKKSMRRVLKGPQ